MSLKLQNEQILCIGFPAWEGDYLKSTVQLVSELAKNNEVLYVEYPFTLKDVLMGSLGKSKAPYRRILGKENRLRTLQLTGGAKVNVLTLPPMLPVNFINQQSLHDALMSTNARIAHASITKAMQTLGMEKPVVINAFNPFLGVFLAGQFDEKALVYYCYDEISAAKWAGKHGGRLEHRFMQQVDAVITSSSPLHERKQHYANRSFLVKNGVDFDLFHQNATHKNSQKKEVIGYLGSLDERVDYDMLSTVIASLPHRKFVFVGRVNAPKAECLRQFPNVEIKGSQSPDSLPGLVSQFDVCMIPFLKNELTAGIYPLKINEYFAAAKPVVTTNFGDMADFRHLVHIADTASSFAAAIETCLVDDNSDQKQQRTTFARKNAWTQRAREMGTAIASVIEENRIAAFSMNALRIPDAYNRWGKVSQQFFNRNSVDQSFIPEDWLPKPAYM